MLATLAATDASSTAAGWMTASGDASSSVTSSPHTAAAAATQTIVVLPGQTLLEGSGISGTPTTQAAGSAFTADVYAVDASFSIDTTATGTVSVVTGDPNDVEPPSQELVSGHATFTITPITATTTGWTITPIGGPGTSVASDPYPVIAAPAARTMVVLPGQTLTEGSGISGSATAQAVDMSFTADVYAVDDYFNVDTTATGTVSVVTGDPNDVEPPSQELVSGHAALTITPATATSTGWTVTPSGGPGANVTSDPYPVLESPLTGTTVYIYPLTQTVMAGSNFQVEVVAANVTNLGAFEFTLAFDPALAQLVSMSHGPFLGSSGRTVSCMPPVETDGRVTLTCVTLGAEPDGPSGSGVLAVAQFSAVGGGTTILDLRDVILLEPAATQIPVDQIIDGSVTVMVSPTPTPTPFLTPTPTTTLEPGVTPTVTLTPTITATATVTPTRTSTPTPTPPPPPTKVRVNPTAQTVSAGDQFTVDVWVDDVVNLGAYQFKLAFDPAAVAFVSVTNGAFLGSTGRGVSCASPMLANSSVQFSCSSLGTQPPGPSGSGVLATVRLEARGTGTSLLDLQEAVLLTPAAQLIPVDQLIDGSVTAVPPTPTSTPTTTLTPTATLVPTATPTLEPGVTPTATYSPTPLPTPTVTRTPTLSPTSTATPGPTTVRIHPIAQNVPVNWVFAVDVRVDDVSNLGAYEFTLAFNPGVLTFTNIYNGSFLGSTGRSVDCMPPQLTSGSVRLECVTLGAQPAGPSGSGVLSRVTFEAVNAGTSMLDLRNVVLLTPAGAPIDVTFVIDGSVTAAFGPTPTITVSPTPTDTPTPGPTPTPGGTLTPTPTLEPGVTPTATPIPVFVAVDPPSQSVSAGQQFTVDVTVADVTNLGSYEWMLEFDHLVIEYVDVVDGSFLGSTDRQVFCPSPILDEGSVRFGCVTSGMEPGASGSGVLSTVTFNALAAGTSALHFPWVSLSDPLGYDIYAVGEDGSVTVTSSTTSALGGPANSSGETGGTAGPALEASSPAPGADTGASGHGRFIVRIVPVMIMAFAVISGLVALAPFAYAALPRWSDALRRRGAHGVHVRGLPVPIDGGLRSSLAEAYRRLRVCLAFLSTGRLGRVPSARASPGRLGVGGLSLGLLAMGAALFAQGGAAMEPSATAGTVSVVKEPAIASLFLGGGEATIAEEVSNVPESGLGAFELAVLYDESIIDLAIQEGPFLGSTGRPTTCSTFFWEDQVQLACTSTGPAPGPSGSGTLANLVVWPDPDLRIRPAADNGVVMLLHDVSAETGLADPLGGDIPVGTVGDALLVVQALEGDFNQDCIVNVFDEQNIALRYHTSFGSVLYDRFYDVEPTQADFDIDIKDLQFVFGRNGWTCPAPSPTPTPTETPAPTGTVEATPTGTPATPSPTGTVEATPTEGPEKTPTPLVTATHSPVPTPTGTIEARSTNAPAKKGTATPPAPTPTAAPTEPVSTTPTSVGEVLPGMATPPSVRPLPEALPPAGIGSASDPKERPPWLLAAGALLTMAAGALITRGVGLRAATRVAVSRKKRPAFGAAAEGPGDPRRSRRS